MEALPYYHTNELIHVNLGGVTLTILYLILPLIAWFVSGSLKFAINYAQHGKDAIAHVGNGGFPSTHTSVVSSVLFLLLFQDGLSKEIAIVAAVLMIVIMDATGLRRTVGRHAGAINKLSDSNPTHPKLREKQGHNGSEIIGGLAVGALLGWVSASLI